jgi:hypothetical protein
MFSLSFDVNLDYLTLYVEVVVDDVVSVNVLLSLWLVVAVVADISRLCIAASDEELAGGCIVVS